MARPRRGPRAATLWLARVTLALVSPLVALAIGEAGLRAWFWSRGVGRSDVTELLRRSQGVPRTELHARSVFGLVQPSAGTSR